MAKKVIVVGAGLGGLSTALRLVKKGYEVEIIEKNGKAGGRLNQIKKDGFTFDTGPSFFSMSYEFKQFAQECNIDIPFKYIELDPLYSVNFSGSPKTYHLYKDSSMLAGQFAEEEPDFKEKFDNYIAGQIEKIDLKNKDIPFLRGKMLEMYSNTLINYLAAHSMN